MRRDCDAASSVVIGFVILLMLVALGIGIWALISVPDMVKEAESTHAIELSNTFLDLKLSADKVRVNNFEGARFSMLMPGSSGMSGTTISFTEDTGIVHMEWSGGEGLVLSPKEWTLDRISAQVGGTRGMTVIGYEGGGVFRSDNGNAVWLTPGLLEIYPDESETKNNTVRVDLVVVNLTGEASVSSNWGVPLDCLYVGSKDDYTFATAQNRTLTISLDGGQKDLWYSLFAEAKSRYDLAKIEYQKTHPNFKIDIEMSNEPNPQLKIGNGIDEWVKVYIREATYDVSLVNRYEES